MTNSEFMRDVLQRIATGPTLSKDLPLEDAQRAMRIILAGDADEVQAGIFLIALRMKRETDDELAGILKAIQKGITPQPVAVAELVTLVDPYDGYLRGTPASPFLPAVLAACGLKVLSHGVRSMGPKFGATHETVLQAAGRHLPADRTSAASALENDECGWAYVSQSQLAPELAALTDLRTRIVKRPCLTTIEATVNSMQPKGASHMVTGFVHKPYPPIYAKLAAVGGFTSSVLVRGVEGGVVPSLTQGARYFTSDDGNTLVQVDIDPESVDIFRHERAVPLPAQLVDNSVRSVKAPQNPFAGELSNYAAQSGMAALEGREGYTRDSLIYSGALIMHALKKVNTLIDGAAEVRRVLDNGKAKLHFVAL